MRAAADPSLEVRPAEAASSPSRMRWFGIAAAGLIALSVGAFQTSHYAYRGSFAEHPDEAAHFVSGVCVLDYFRTALGTNPVRFVESYYAHFPKVSLGHWPPMFYIIQAIWYAALGESAVHSILLAGAAAAFTALVLLLRLKRLYGNTIALLGAAVFLWLPLVRASELMVMADMPAALFLLLAIFAFCDACVFQRRQYWLLTGLWTAVAVLTKESALTLAVIIPVALAWRYGKPLFSPNRLKVVVAAAASAILLLGLLYAAGGVLRIRGFPLFFSMKIVWGVLPQLASFFQNASLLVFPIAGAAVLALFRGKYSRATDRGVHVATSAIWLACTLVCQWFVRDSFEPRYLLPAYLPALILMAEGLFLIQDDIRRRWNRAAIAVAAIVSLTAACLISTPRLSLHQRTGYAQVAAAIPFDSDDRVVLVSADERGEGSMVAELLLDDPGRGGVVLRATKVLSSSDWLGRDYSLLMKTPESLLQFLNATPVHFVVIDMTGFVSEIARPHHRLLEETIRDYSGQFRLVGDFPLHFDGHRRDHSVQVYENLAVRGRRAQAIHLDMTKTLGHDLDIRLMSLHTRARKTTPGTSGSERPDVVPTSFSVAPNGDAVPARGGAGRLYVTAPPSYSWSLQNVPEWIRIKDGAGTGDGIVSYEVMENRTNFRRTATFAVGNLTFSVTQPRSATTHVPYSGEFLEAVESLWIREPADPNSIVDPPGQWALEDQSGQGAHVVLTGETAAGMRGLMLERAGGETENWKTRLSLLRIDLLLGRKYRAAVWMKAERPAQVWMTLLSESEPSHVCGFSAAVPVTTVWSEFHVEFRVAEACGANDSRFVLETGKIVGRLWVAKFSLAESQ